MAVIAEETDVNAVDGDAETNTGTDEDAADEAGMVAVQWRRQWNSFHGRVGGDSEAETRDGLKNRRDDGDRKA